MLQFVVSGQLGLLQCGASGFVLFYCMSCCVRLCRFVLRVFCCVVCGQACIVARQPLSQSTQRRASARFLFTDLARDMGRDEHVV